MDRVACRMDRGERTIKDKVGLNNLGEKDERWVSCNMNQFKQIIPFLRGSL